MFLCVCACYVYHFRTQNETQSWFLLPQDQHINKTKCFLSHILKQQQLEPRRSLIVIGKALPHGGFGPFPLEPR